MEAKDEKQKRYQPVEFKAKYANESTDARYQRLLREFDAKFTRSLVIMHEELEEKAKEGNEAAKEFEKSIKHYEKQVKGLRETIEFFSKQTLQKHPDSDLLTIGGYPGKEFIIELLSRSATVFDEPANDENKIQLLLLANEIPEDTKGYWRQIKIGILFFITEVVAIGIVLGGAFGLALLFPPATIPLVGLLLSVLTLTSASLGVAFGGAYLMNKELNDIERTTRSQAIKKIITTNKHSFLAPSSSSTSQGGLKNDRDENPGAPGGSPGKA